MLSVKEAAARACVCEAVVYGWCSAGRLPHYRVGLKRGKILIAVEDLDALLASFKVGASPTPARPPSRGGFKHLRLG